MLADKEREKQRVSVGNEDRKHRIKRANGSLTKLFDHVTVGSASRPGTCSFIAVLAVLLVAHNAADAHCRSPARPAVLRSTRWRSASIASRWLRGWRSQVPCFTCVGSTRVRLVMWGTRGPTRVIIVGAVCRANARAFCNILHCWLRMGGRRRRVHIVGLCCVRLMRYTMVRRAA